MWDLFLAFLLIAMGAILAIYELRQWLATKRWIHLLVVVIAILGELAVILGFLYSLVLLVFALVLMEIAAHSNK